MSEQIFDEIAGRYDEVLNESLASSGESREYFARQRLLTLRSLLKINHVPMPRSILDYGCGTGGSMPALKEFFPDAILVGTDISKASLEVARQKYPEPNIRFLSEEEIGDEQFDLIFCNGVFHHIAPLDRLPALLFIRKHLPISGLFAFFENNPWNPGTRYIMSRCPFDKNAMVISPSKAVKLLESQGFQWIIVHSLFYFPRVLSLFRIFEGFLGRFPLGGQYLVVCRVSP